MTDPCVFCQIISRQAPATRVHEWPNAVAIVPLTPVTFGHVLVIPKTHVEDALENPVVSGQMMMRAAEYAAQRRSKGTFKSYNILSSAGRAATQSVPHLHVHVVPRTETDGLMLPWGTVYGDNPAAPHWCRVADRLTDALARMTGERGA